MLAMDELEGVVANERHALITRDWALLAECSERKEQLCDALAQANALDDVAGDRLRAVRRQVLHNAQLAAGLRKQLGDMLHGPPTSYTRRAQARRIQPRLVSRTG